jgi:hypothetical protein
MLFLILFATHSFALSLDDVFSNFEGTWTRAESSTNTQIESFERIKDGIWHFQFESNNDSFVVTGTAFVVIRHGEIEICRNVIERKNNPCFGVQKNQTILAINSGSFIWIVNTNNDLRIEVTYRLISDSQMQKTISAYSSGLERQIAQTIYFDRAQNF